MIHSQNRYGSVEISSEYFTSLIGHAAKECFGVKGMANSNATQGLRSTLFNKDFPSKGVHVISGKDGLVIDIHVILTYGVNISAVTSSLVSKVKYAVEEATGFAVAKVNVFVDGIQE